MAENKEKKESKGQETFAAYNVIRNRLLERSNELKSSLDKLNKERIGVFGEKVAKLIKTEAILTENNCIPRDIVPIGNKVILGYNVHMGLKSKIKIDDVFSIYEYNGENFSKSDYSLLTDNKFISEFEDLYKYYKESFFAKFFEKNGYLYMVFQNGNDFSNIKAFKWFINDNKLEYAGNRSSHEVDYGLQQEIDWKKTGREEQVNGEHPHVSIEDKLFVETIGGDLTLKIENNTSSGKGIYSEPVDNMDQSLDDGDISYAIVGNIILLRIKPYQEKNYRYFAFNQKTKEVHRIDSIGKACILLPENHGVLVPNGLIRQSGGGFSKFDVDFENIVFNEKKVSQNGEDYQYIFYNHKSGEYYIYSYNIINQNANPPIVASGYAHFDNGHMAVFKAESEPKRNHTLKIWETSFSTEISVENEEVKGSFLYNLGNKSIVKAIADITTLYKLIRREDSYYGLYVDIVNDTETIINNFFWLDKKEAFGLKDSLLLIKEAAAIAIKEYEKVNLIKEETKKESIRVEEACESILKTIKYTTFEKINDFVSYLSKLRKLRGEIASLKELQFVDLNKVEKLANSIREANEKISEDCVNFLLLDESLSPYITSVEECKDSLSNITKVVDGKELEEKIVGISEELELLITIVNSLKIDDTTKSSEIIDKISSLFATLNGIKSKLNNIVDNLDSKERKTEFYSKLNLITQSISNYLNLSDTIEKVDSYLTKIIVQIDELESKFSDFEEFIPQLTEKREEIVSAFTQKKQGLIEKKNKKINSLFDASERVFKGLSNRLKSIDDPKVINEIFSTDLMVEKVRDIIENLIKLGDGTKASEIESKLKSLKENTIRQLKDKKELFLDGNTIKFGNNNFLVSDGKTELTLLRKTDGFYYHISGTDYFEKVDENILSKYKDVWNQELISESTNIYRSEFLAFNIFKSFEDNNTLDKLYTLSKEGLKKLVDEYVESHYNEYYTKGVHDVDGLKILETIVKTNKEIGLSLYKPEVRAMANYFWNFGIEEAEKEKIEVRLKTLSIINRHKSGNFVNMLIPYLREKVEVFYENYDFFPRANFDRIALYLALEVSSHSNFVLSKEGEELYLDFNNYLTSLNAKEDFKHSLNKLKDDLHGSYILVSEWINTYLNHNNSPQNSYLEEVKNLYLIGDIEGRRKVPESSKIKISDLIGVHSLIENGNYEINLVDFFYKLEEFTGKNLLLFNDFQKLKNKLIEDRKYNLKFNELKPRVLTSFVRNKLIDQVYLPLIGDNFAKQIGVAGANKRTDNMGMLLLISPPGYGKTTLMEYIANRLNMLLVKINCPTIGHGVTSLDPSEAKNANAKEELEKLNLAFEMGNNVIIYLDDIQHSNPEFLQKFISLCDGQRKIEGIWQGRSKSYEFRGKKVAVVMAGNPYTESGDKFQIPDMLSNRADVYNLGDMLRENEEAFKLSYLENAMTSNPYLNKLYMKNQDDTYKLINAVQMDNREDIELEGNYTEADLEEYSSLLTNMIKVRDEILRVNMEYIHSAGQNDKYRVEPPFKLQGSYRNMNKIAERIVPVMNKDEIRDLILKAYENDAQTLASDSEASLLKFREISNRLDETTLNRWNEIKKIFLDSKSDSNEKGVLQVVEELSKIGINLKVLSELFNKK